MTELEQNQLAQLAQGLRNPTFNGLMQALTTAYALGRASLRTPAQIAAWERNRMKGGKPGRKDSKPRVRRTRAQIEAQKQQEMK